MESIPSFKKYRDRIPERRNPPVREHLGTYGCERWPESRDARVSKATETLSTRGRAREIRREAFRRTLCRFDGELSKEQARKLEELKYQIWCLKMYLDYSVLRLTEKQFEKVLPKMTTFRDNDGLMLKGTRGGNSDSF